MAQGHPVNSALEIPQVYDSASFRAQGNHKHAALGGELCERELAELAHGRGIEA